MSKADILIAAEIFAGATLFTLFVRWLGRVFPDERYSPPPTDKDKP